MISEAIGFSRYVGSFGAYIISQATGFLRYAASFEAYLRSKAAGFPRSLHSSSFWKSGQGKGRKLAMAYGQGKGRKRGWESSCHGLRYPPL
jgi:hypothetical protein